MHRSLDPTRERTPITGPPRGCRGGPGTRAPVSPQQAPLTMDNTLKSAIPDPRVPVRYEFKGPIYRSFMEQAKRVPQARALVSRHEHFTYAELDEISSRVAAYLKHRGVGRGHTVVIFSDRNPALVAAMLGVLKAG